jgi:hypothetical protein
MSHVLIMLDMPCFRRKYFKTVVKSQTPFYGEFSSLSIMLITLQLILHV